MTTNKVKGWKTEITADSITFDRGDWFCVARFRDVVGLGMGEGDVLYSLGAMAIVSNFIASGAPIRKRSATYNAMIDAITEATRAAN